MKLMGGRRTFPLPPPRPVMLVAGRMDRCGSYALKVVPSEDKANNAVYWKSLDAPSAAKSTGRLAGQPGSTEFRRNDVAAEQCPLTGFTLSVFTLHSSLFTLHPPLFTFHSSPSPLHPSPLHP